MPSMNRTTLAGGMTVILLIIVVLAVGYKTFEQHTAPAPATSSAISPAPAAAHPSFLYGRITTVGGTTYEGRLRFGGDEEAFWGHYFNGFKAKNSWAGQVPTEQLSKEHLSLTIFGWEIFGGERQIDLGRPFMARFGDIARIDAIGDGVQAALERGIKYHPELRVTLKNGAVFDLDRFEADDFADGVRVWDDRHGVVDLEEHKIRSIEFLPPARHGDVPDRLYGTVQTHQGDFTGFLQWDREETLGHDELVGRTADGEVSLRFSSIRSIARHSDNSSLVTLLDGREVVLSDTRKVGHGNRGIYVDDQRYGRVLVSWDAFERVAFSPGGSGPAYDDFPPGHPLTGTVTTRDGRRLAGRLVYDLDESQVTETLDAPSQGVDYTIPFGLVAAIMLPDGEAHARVTLQSGEELPLERTGDLGEENAGMLIFSNEHPEYVSWSDVEQIAFDRPPAMYPSVGGR